MNFHLPLLLLGPAVLAVAAAFMSRRILSVLLLVFAVVVFVTFFPWYLDWMCVRDHLTMEETAQVHKEAQDSKWLIWAGGTVFIVLPAFGAAKFGRYLARRRACKHGLRV